MEMDKVVRDYKVKRVIFEFNNVKIFLVRKQGSQEEFALKEIKLIRSYSQEKIRKVNEAIQKMPQDELLVCIHQFFLEQIKDKWYAYILMEYCQNSLEGILSQDYFNNNPRIPIIKQLVHAFNQHRKLIGFHQRLKPNKVLIKSNKVKILPILSQNQLGLTTLVAQTSGSQTGANMFYEPLERKSKKPDIRSNVWTLGLLLLEIAKGTALPNLIGKQPPHAQQGFPKSQIFDDLPKQLTQNGTKNHFEKLIRDMLLLNPEDRISQDSIVQSDFFKEIDRADTVKSEKKEKGKKKNEVNTILLILSKRKKQKIKKRYIQNKERKSEQKEGEDLQIHSSIQQKVSLTQISFKQFYAALSKRKKDIDLCIVSMFVSLMFRSLQFKLSQLENRPGKHCLVFDKYYVNSLKNLISVCLNHKLIIKNDIQQRQAGFMEKYDACLLKKVDQNLEQINKKIQNRASKDDLKSLYEEGRGLLKQVSPHRKELKQLAEKYDSLEAQVSVGYLERLD